MFYADTSAILPYYREEVASITVEKWLRSCTEPVLISDLARVEVASALARWVRMNELSESGANRIEAAFFEDVYEGRFRTVEMKPAVFERANHWVLTRRTSLRTLDSLHVACAELHEAEMVTLDMGLLEAARFLGMKAVRPEEVSFT